MGDDPVELKETFDGYLMFDFSNFHGLMAQTFDDPEDEELNDSMTQIVGQRNGNQQHSQVPGPYLDSPAQELNQEGDDGDVFYNGEIIDDDEIPDLNLEDDEQCMSNFQNNSSEFNLLANLDFEPDDDAYENAINLTSNEHNNQVRDKSVSRRDKKVSIFSPSLQYEDNQELDKRIQMINIQNIELLKEEYNYDEFYKFLRNLEFLNFSNFKTNEDHIKIDQLIHLVEIRIQLEKMCEIFQRWTHLTPSISFSSRLQFFQLQLDHFIDIVNYIIDNGAARQKHFQPREGLMNQHNHNVNNNDKQQQNWVARQSELQNVNQIFRAHTLTMSVGFFKAMEIVQQYKNFLHFRNLSEKFKEINRCFNLIKSRLRLIGIFKKAKIEFIQKNSKQIQNYILSTNQTIQYQQDLEIKTSNSPIVDCYLAQIGQKKIVGLDNYFNNQKSNIYKHDHKYIITKKLKQQKINTFKWSSYLEYSSDNNLEY